MKNVTGVPNNPLGGWIHNTLLWAIKTCLCCTRITHSRSIQVELGKVEGF